MKTQKTYTFQAAGSTEFYQWMPRVEVDNGYDRPQRQQITLSTYNRFVRLANSGQYDVTIEAQESVAWQLSRKREISPDAQDFYNESDYIAALDDWKKHDHVDHFAAADYYDEVARQQA